MSLAQMVIDWEQISLLVGVLSPLVGVPLAVITLYLRAIREHQTHAAREIGQRIQAVESGLRDLLRSTTEFEREYTTKEEWVRESMFTRQRLDRLAELMTRVQTELENEHGVAAQMARIAGAVVEAVRHLAPGPSSAGAAGPVAATPEVSCTRRNP